MRNAYLTQFELWRERPGIRLLAKAWGAPRLYQEYTSARDAFAIIRLAQWLERHGVQTKISTTPNLPAELPEANLIFSGVPGSSRHIERHLRTASFHVDVGMAWRVYNRNPKPGERAEYDEQRHSGRRLVQPGILALLPGLSHNAKLLLLAGRPTPALATFLTSSEGLIPWKPGSGKREPL
ncbi:MAG TPA: hypothetical protein VN442_10950 [Bryobacteraceae bacterium]|nr:hypothetical protein [Bryobacteraceae bacterium]